MISLILAWMILAKFLTEISFGAIPRKPGIVMKVFDFASSLNALPN